MGQKQDQVVYLENDIIRVGILPAVGGRMVYFGFTNQENILKSDSGLWNEPKKDRIKPSAFADFKAYNGHITWVGPQSAWWTNQNINAERKALKNNWPPDPYLIYGKFKIIEKSDSTLICVGPKSPISGVQLTKKYVISNNKLHLEVCAKNIRKEQVGIDLWSNARFEGDTKFFVPLTRNEILKIDTLTSATKDPLKASVQNNIFTFIAEPPSGNKLERSGKAFLNKSEGKMIAVVESSLLVIAFDKVNPQNIHPDQAFVEVFNKIDRNMDESLLELEHHSPYRILAPGEELNLNETWTLEKYTGTFELKELYKLTQIY